MEKIHHKVIEHHRKIVHHLHHHHQRLNAHNIKLAEIIISIFLAVGVLVGVYVATHPTAITPSAAPEEEKQYIVVFKDNIADGGSATSDMVKNHKVNVRHVYKKVLKGYSTSLTATKLNEIKQDPLVSFVSEDRPIHAEALIGTGLTGNYYNTIDFTGSSLVRTDATINFNWVSGTPDQSIAPDTFSIRWTGFVKPRFSQNYTFYSKADDGVRLWINDQLIIDNWHDQTAIEKSGTINLQAGKLYTIKMEYYENRGYASAQLRWSSLSQVKQIIPQQYLYPATNSLTSSSTSVSQNSRLPTPSASDNPLLLPPSAQLPTPSASDNPLLLPQPTPSPTPNAQVIPTGVSRIGLNNVNKGSGITIAVIDTGIELSHPDLKENIVANVNCMDPTKSGNDGYGHGTHVAGIIAAQDNNIGVRGVAPDSKVVAVKALDDTGNGGWSNVICGIDWVTENAALYNIKVANLSIAGGGSSDNNCGNTNGDALHLAICRSVEQTGVTYVVAAGNSMVDASTIVPAAYNDTVITVSALADSDGKAGGMDTTGYDDTFASFSDFGPDVDLAAPGVNIISTWISGGYLTSSGTSMAAPHVAGAAALYLKSHPTATWTQVRDALITSGEPLNHGHTDPSGKHPEPVVLAGKL